MPYDSDKRKEHAQEQVRDASGHFIPKKKAVKSVVKSKVDTSNESSLNDPLVSININNPFKKLLLWIDEIRKKQETVLDIKLKLPLVVILSVAAMVFGIATSSKYFYDWGKYIGIAQAQSLPTPTPVIIIPPTATPAPVLVTRMGVLMATYQLPSSVPDTSSQSASPVVEPSRYVLVGRAGDVLFLQILPGVAVQGYIGKRLLITGLYNLSTNTLQIRSSQDIEVLR